MNTRQNPHTYKYIQQIYKYKYIFKYGHSQDSRKRQRAKTHEKKHTRNSV